MIAQLIIMICGVASVWLSQDHRQDYRRYACLFGIFAQPFWMVETWQAQQYGIFALAFVYAFGWIRGIRNHWLK